MPEFLYIHIPFCIRKCIYCDFLSVPYDELFARGYVDSLCKELTLKKHLSKELKTIYIGGGTPSILPEKSFREFFKCLRDNFKFSPGIEITVEANPGAISESKINAMLSFGVNRISIGVQSFNDNELRTLGRIHTSDEAVKSIEIIKKSGLRNFSIDLMYGIPGQSMNAWKESLSKAVSFSPTHISSYELTPEKNTPLYEMIESTSPLTNGGPGGVNAKGGHRWVIDVGKGGFSGKIKMPDEELVLEMYGYAIDSLTGNGYEHYEISNFALPEFTCIHNLNYWDRGEYLGAGAGAHSFINGVRSRNTDNLDKYIEDLRNNKIPEIESMRLTAEDAVQEFIFLGLRKIEGISLMKAKEFGLNILDAGKELINEEYLEISNDNLKLTRKGFVISNEIIVRLFEGLGLD